MKEKVKKILWYTVSLALACILLFFSFRGVKWSDFLAGLRACRWEFILVSMAAGIAAFWFRGLRWRGLLLPIDADVRRLTTFNAVNIGYIANFVFPRIGEFVRCGIVSKNSRDNSASYDKVLGTVVLERGWDMLSMLAVLVTLLLFRWEKFGAFFVDRMWTPVSDNLSFSLWWIVAAVAAAAGACVWAVASFRDRNAVAAKIHGVFRGLLYGFGSCLKMKDKWKFFAYTLAIWGLYWLMSISTMCALPELDGLNAVDALFLMVAGSPGWLVPVPGGFGAFHFIVSLALSTIYGIPFESGIIFATLSHESQAVTMVLCGGVSYVYETFKK